MKHNINILFTSVGRRVALMQTFRDALQALGLQGRIIGIDRSPLAPALQSVDAAHVVPAVDEENYAAVLLNIVRQENVSVVLPLIDPDVPVLTRLRDQLESLGAGVATVLETGMPAVADKWQTDRLLRRLTIDRPASWLPGEMDQVPREFPLFVKPRMGSASGDCFRIDNEQQLRFFAQYVPQAIIQEFLPGPEISNDVICGLDGKVLSVVSRQRIQVRGGEVAIGKTVHHPDIADSCVAIATELGATGPITIQCIMKNGQPKFTEINARLGGGAPCGVLAGADWPQTLLANLAGIEIRPRDLCAYRAEVVFSRYDNSIDVSAPRRSAIPKVKSAGQVYVIGGGGHAKVVISLLRSLGYEVTSLFDDDPTRWDRTCCGIPITGPIERIAELPRLPTVIAVGDNQARRRLVNRFDLEWLTVVHDRAFVDPSAQLGAGTVVMAGSIVQADAMIGDHVIINTNASVDHDCIIGDFAHVAPGAKLAGHVTIETGVLFGVGASSIPRVHVGARAIVGAGAAVVRDLPPDTIAKGVPATWTARESQEGIAGHGKSERVIR